MKGHAAKSEATTDAEPAPAHTHAHHDHHHHRQAKPPSIFNQSWHTTWRKAVVSLPRLVPDASLRLTSREGPQPIVCKIPSRGKHQIPLYIFVPPSITPDTRETKQTGPRSCPVLLDFHGGGFVLGSCQEQAPFCAKLCRELNCIAISVDYRLGPYAQFPAAIEDAEDVLHAILDPSKLGYTEVRQAVQSALLQQQAEKGIKSRIQVELDTTRLAISGFSSGGSLALNLALSIPPTPPYVHQRWPSLIPRTHDKPIPLLLFYPALDTRLLPHERPLAPGMDAPKGLLASLNLEAELMPTYLPKHLTSHPRASPALVSLARLGDNDDEVALHHASKVLLVLPELDTLTASSATWVRRVTEETSGADLEVVQVPRMAHGWTQFPDQMLSAEAKQRKKDVFDRSVGFVQEQWGMTC